MKTMADPVTSLILLITIVIGSPLAMFIMILWWDVRGLSKSIIMFFETEKLAKMLRKDVKDGSVKIGKKKYFIDKAKPQGLLKSGIFFKALRPLYVIKWNKPIPASFTEKGLCIDYDSENLQNLIENRTLAQLLSPAKTGKELILYFIIGSVMGGLLGYVIATI